MKSLIVLVGMMISFSVLAAQSLTNQDQYIYQVLVPSTDNTCEVEASLFAQRFSKATGAEITESSCQGIVSLPADNANYSMYSLAVRYTSSAPYYPYKIEIGGVDSYTYSGYSPGYDSFASCLNDISNQTLMFKEQTGLTPVSSTCDKTNSLNVKFKLSIEGFSSKSNQAYPIKRLYVFSTLTSNSLTKEQQESIADIISKQEAFIVKQDGSSFAYYAKSLVNVKSQVLATSTDQECNSQVEHVQAMLSKLGAKNTYIWCISPNFNRGLQKDLFVVYDGVYRLRGDNGYSSQQRYYTFDQCISSRDLLLSDSRNKQILGGLCHKPVSIIDDTYILELFTKSDY